MKKLSVLLALGGMVAASGALQMQAQVVSFTFEAPVATGDWSGVTGYGKFSYDASQVPSDGWINPEYLTLSFWILGQNFDQADDSGFPTYPQLQLVGGEPNYLSFWIEEPPTSISEEGVVQIYLEGFLTKLGSPSNSDYLIQANVVGTKVPEPSAMAFSAVALLGLGTFIARRRQAKKG